jgi:STE24 endopeptidase
VSDLARKEGVPGTRGEVQDVRRFTTAPNAEAVGFGPTRRVVLWDTLLDGRFGEREIAIVIAHELGHIAHEHVLKRVGWLLLFLLPATALVALATARRGGLGRPEAVPLALLVFIALQIATTPLMNIVSRRDEAEADWSALNATGDTKAARALFLRLARTSHANPDPPTWSYVMFATHPTIAQRVAMVYTYEKRSP